MSKEKLIGTWNLAKYTLEAEDGAVVYPFGEDGIGKIIYLEDETMSVHLMRNNREPMKGDPLSGSVVMSDYFSYYGTYKVSDNVVTHSISLCIYPNWIGQDQVRFFEFKSGENGKNILILSATLTVDDKNIQAKLIWKK